MAEKQDKKGSKKKLKDSLKAVTTTAILAGGLLVSTSPPVKANDVSAKVGDIQHRVEMVRNALRKKLTTPEQANEKLSYSEMELAQWGNWVNWGNWNNWRNWNNWNDWRKWANWANWVNY
jgi:hypothetical protein